MTHTSFLKLILIASLFVFIACDSKPRVIQSQSAKASVSPNSIPALEEMGATHPATTTATPTTASSSHAVVVQEVLPTDKYAYLRVMEGDKKYWVAIPKMDIEVGESLRYEGGLLKKNFYSQEYDRVFETVYLVSKIWRQNPQVETATTAQVTKTKAGASLNVKVDNITPTEGAITIAELFTNKEKYNRKVVKITGKCVKVNPKIMKRNWIHLQDGSGKEFDLTITTQQDIPLGAVLTLEGTIALDRDFGAGYRYDIIMEGAEVKGGK